MNYRYYSIGRAPTGSPRAGTLIVLGWSRDQEHAIARKGTQYWAHAGSRTQAANKLRRQFGIDVDTRK